MSCKPYVMQAIWMPGAAAPRGFTVTEFTTRVQAMTGQAGYWGAQPPPRPQARALPPHRPRLRDLRTGMQSLFRDLGITPVTLAAA
jgi:hypothetical protein